MVRFAERVRRRAPWLWGNPVAGPLQAVLARALLRSGYCDLYAAASRLGGSTAREVARRRVGQLVRAGDFPLDEGAYRAASGLRAADDPLLHLVAHRGGNAAAAGFDAAGYLAQNPDVRRMRRDPLEHFLTQGRAEGRLAPATRWPPPSPPRIAAKRAGRSPETCVVIPVHGAEEATLACVASVVAAACRTPYEILVIDDASPDTGVRAALAPFAEAGTLRLLVNAVNQGFSATVNRGLAERAAGTDAIVLNSDTLVYDGWIDRLRDAAGAVPKVGTVTPLSNSATILSYPIPLRDNAMPLELDWRTLDRLAAELESPPVEIPTAVGFCMYVTADCLDDVGGFDAAAFPRGYGEENDFCLRASARGWRHLAATNLFVAHRGGASFGADRRALIEQGLRVIDERFPAYRRTVEDFIRRDPLAQVRAALDCARIRLAHPRPTLRHHVAGEPDGAGELRIVRDPAGDTLRLHSATVRTVPNLPRLAITDTPQEIATGLSLFGAAALVLDDREWLGAAWVARLEAAARSIGLPGG